MTNHPHPAQPPTPSAGPTETTPPPKTVPFPADTTVDPEELSFEARAGGTGRKIVKYTLAFGDTTSLTEDGLNIVYPNLLIRTISHDYETGSYTATLKVWDDLNNTDEESLTIEGTP